MCPAPPPNTQTPEKKTVQDLWLRDCHFRMKTASVTVIIVTPHFIVSNGNGVVMGETVISLITRYWKSNAVSNAIYL